MNTAEIISHFAIMKKQSEDGLKRGDEGEIGDQSRGTYIGEISAYRHCIEYLLREFGKGSDEMTNIRHNQ